MLIIGLFGLVWILAFHSLFKQFSAPLIALFVHASILALLLYFRADQLHPCFTKSNFKNVQKER